MTVTLVLPDQLASELLDATMIDVETAYVLLAKYVKTPDKNIRLLGRDLHCVPDDAYLLREPKALSIASHGYVPALGIAEADQSVPLWLHTHPGRHASPRPSKQDELVDEQLADLFRLRADSTLYGALIVAQEKGRLSFTGHIESETSRTEIDRLWVTGKRLTLLANWLHDKAQLSDQFDRNIRAFGGEIQRVLGELRVAVVGCGGTGSAVIEQLVRIGVRHLSLFDPDTISIGNLTRVYGSCPEDVGRPKVDVSALHIKRIAPDATVTTHQSSITLESTARISARCRHHLWMHR